MCLYRVKKQNTELMSPMWPFFRKEPNRRKAREGREMRRTARMKMRMKPRKMMVTKRLMRWRS